MLFAMMMTASAAPLLPPPASPLPGSAAVRGMTARWRVEPEAVVFELQGETTGWLLVGFNDRDDIVGADLTFARVVDGVATLHDHTVHAPGDHRAVPLQTTLLGSDQRDGRTAVRFRVPRDRAGAHALSGELWLVLAWSVSPDLDHHSRVRAHQQISLPE